MKLRPLGIDLPSHDLSYLPDRAACWNLLTELAAHSTTVNIKAARSLFPL